MGTPKEYILLDLSSVNQSSVNINTGTISNLTNNNFTDGATTHQTITIPFTSVTQSSVNGFTGNVANLTTLKPMALDSTPAVVALAVARAALAALGVTAEPLPTLVEQSVVFPAR